MKKSILFSIIVLSLVSFYFSGFSYGFDIVKQVLAVLAVFLFLFFAAKKGQHQFFVAVLALFSLIVSLGCAFLNKNEATGPLAINLILNPWVIIVISVVISTLLFFWQDRGKSKDRFATIMLILFVLNWIILAFNVHFYEDWKIENWLTVPFVLLIYLTHRWFHFSNVSYGLIFLYLMFHIYGSHYTYAEVPFGFWMQDVFNMTRNHYDRIVHFSFGFLLAYPIRETVVRISDTKGFWSYWFPIEFVLAFSAVYELLEWWVALVFGGDLGIAYLGTQGDVWDAQKDMFVAGGGAVLAMFIVALVVWYYWRGKFWTEIRESLTIKHQKALGEVALREIKR